MSPWKVKAAASWSLLVLHEGRGANVSIGQMRSTPNTATRTSRSMGLVLRIRRRIGQLWQQDDARKMVVDVYLAT